MNLKPLFDRVILKPIEREEKTVGGIFIPESAVEKPQIATVIAVGDGYSAEGKTCEMKVDVGNKVLYSKFAGVNFKEKEEEFVIVRQGDILAIVEEE